MATTTTSTVAPEIAPYLTYGLQQAAGMYQQGERNTTQAKPL